jgi:predicted enzyme related to lactoylglutathione lyase
MEQTGGKMIVSKTKVSGMGFIAVFLDSEQNMFEIFEKDEF